MTAAADDPAIIVEKTMSLSRAEFERSMRVLDPALGPSTHYRLTCGQGHVSITYLELPGVRLGSLLALPRAHLTLAFDATDAAARAAFQRRFDLAFQRGGG
jgi:hypothetical protein